MCTWESNIFVFSSTSKKLVPALEAYIRNDISQNHPFQTISDFDQNFDANFYRLPKNHLCEKNQK